mgnify:CR=1 FL=1
MSGQRGLRKADAESVYKMTQGCPCDDCHLRNECFRECPTFTAWTDELCRGKKRIRSRVKKQLED